MVGIPQERVGEARLQQVHGEPRALLHNKVEEDVDRLPVLCFFPGDDISAILRQAEERGAGEGEELLESVLNVVAAADGEEDAESLVYGRGQAVDVVLMAVELGLERF